MEHRTNEEQWLIAKQAMLKSIIEKMPTGDIKVVQSWIKEMFDFSMGLLGEQKNGKSAQPQTAKTEKPVDINSAKTRFIPSEISVLKTKKKGVPFYKIFDEEGVGYVTFDKDQAKIAQDAVDNNYAVAVVYTVTEYGNKILSLTHYGD